MEKEAGKKTGKKKGGGGVRGRVKKGQGGYHTHTKPCAA